jgi:16S rRNA C967 or C1407 C5-methylase (RsmB/RsmF family)/NOL1/NOP2/fmu family ribosome biogenesis protein
MRSLLGDEYNDFVQAMHTPAPVSVRINKGKDAVEMNTDGIVPWCANGFYLPERKRFTFDPLFHAGAYYVQEAASMFLHHALAGYIEKPVRCLDLCAAPGGKSTLLCDMLPDESMLVCNETVRSRSNILYENIIKWGRSFTIITNNDAAELGRLAGFFDIIVADLPCSGEGMFRKDARSIDEWSVNNVNLCAARQRRIVCDVWKALRPGGIFVYSTCTYNIEENEENIHFIMENLGAEPLTIPVEGSWKISGSLKYNIPVARFFPHRTRSEGFFLCLLRKTDDDMPVRKTKPEKKRNSTYSPPRDLLIAPERFDIEASGTSIKAIPRVHRNDFSYLTENLRIIYSGIHLGELKGKDFIPAHALSMSIDLNKESFTSAELSRDEAIRYLQKETFLLNTEKGYVLISYNNLPLGFIKHLGSRFNNLYPQEWRIRSRE